MRIDTVEITNFRCFESLRLDLHPRLNVLVGLNGSGKTAILEALKYGLIGAVGELKGAVPQKTVQSGFKLDPNKDVKTTLFEHGEWFQQDICSITMTGSFDNKTYEWERSLEKANVKYRHSDSTKAIKNIFEHINKGLATNENIELPLFVYHSTGRLFLESKDTKQTMNGRRIDGYMNAHTAKSSQFFFKNWFEKYERNQKRYQKVGIDFDFSSFERVKELLVRFIPNCTSILYDDLKFKDIVFVFDSGQSLPYSMLSDGLRNLVAMVSDLALRCAVLNPWMGDKINAVSGVVLIDEVDLHLHPSWQRMVIPSLLKVFPNIQFIITTHSPMTLASLEPYITDPVPNIFTLKNNNIFSIQNELVGTANHWLTDIFDILEPRSIEGEEALINAKKILTINNPLKNEVQDAHENLLKHIQAHDAFWVRWNYFAQQHGVAL